MTKLDFDKMQGLIPAVLQDADSGEVLMLGFMNPAALAETLISTDCDRDTLLLRVRMLGDGLICHRGTRSCFTESLVTESLSPSPEFSGTTK